MSNNIFEVLKNKKIKAEEVKKKLVDIEDDLEPVKIDENKIIDNEENKIVNNAINKTKKTDEKEDTNEIKDTNKIEDTNEIENTNKELNEMIDEIVNHSPIEVKNLLKMFGIEVIQKDNKFFMSDNNSLKEISEYEMKKMYFTNLYKETEGDKNIDEALKLFNEKFKNKESLMEFVKKADRKIDNIPQKAVNKYSQSLKKLLKKTQPFNEELKEETKEQNKKVKEVFDEIIDNKKFVNYEPLLKIISYFKKKEKYFEKKEILENKLNKINENIKKIDDKELEKKKKEKENIEKILKKETIKFEKINENAKNIFKTFLNTEILADKQDDEKLKENLNSMLNTLDKKEFESNLLEIDKLSKDQNKKEDLETYENLSLKTLLKLCDEVLESLDKAIEKAETLNKEIENKIIKNSTKSEKNISTKNEKDDTILNDLKIEKRRKI